MHAFLSNLANRQTDRQTNKQTRAKHVRPPLSEVNKSQSEIKGPGSIKILDPVKDVYMLITCLLLKIFSLYISVGPSKLRGTRTPTAFLNASM